MLLFMRHESVSGLIVSESDMIFLLPGPDKSNHIDKVSVVAKSKNVNTVFKELHSTERQSCLLCGYVYYGLSSRKLEVKRGRDTLKMPLQ